MIFGQFVTIKCYIMKLQLIFIFQLLTYICMAQSDTVSYQKYLFHIGGGPDINKVFIAATNPSYQDITSSYRLDFHIGGHIQRQLSKKAYLGLGLQYCRISHEIRRERLFVETNIQEPSTGFFKGSSHYIALPIVYTLRSSTSAGPFIQINAGAMYGFSRQSSFEIKAQSGKPVDSIGLHRMPLREWLVYSQIHLGHSFSLRSGTCATASVFFTAMSHRQLPVPPFTLSYTIGVSLGVNIQRITHNQTSSNGSK